jgi:methionyl-tRNA formyltransferase
LGNINVHASLLPKYRGAAPIQWAIAQGETVTGVTTMKIDAGLDTGDMLLKAELPIDFSDTSETLSPKLAAVGSELLVETLNKIQTIKPQPQDNSKASLAPILKKEDGKINFALTADEICNRLRGFQPWPGAFTSFREKSLQITQAKVLKQTVSPSELSVENNRLLAGCAQQTAIEIIELQPEGKKRMPAKDFIHGYHPKSGEKLGTGN